MAERKAIPEDYDVTLSSVGGGTSTTDGLVCTFTACRQIKRRISTKLFHIYFSLV